MYEFIAELAIALVITYFFVKKEKPKLKFLYLGYLFFFVALLIQLPVNILQVKVKEYLSPALSFLILGTLSIIIGEVTKYLSLKRFMKTRSVKNGILFGIGWSTVESITFFSLYFYMFFFGIFNINFDYSMFLAPIPPLLTFAFFFIVNLGVTVLVILSIIRKKLPYLYFAIVLQFVLALGLFFLSGQALTIFAIGAIAYALYLIFKYHKISKR